MRSVEGRVGFTHSEGLRGTRDSDHLGFEGEEAGDSDGDVVGPDYWPASSLHLPVSNGPVESVTLENSPLVWKEGRQLLRQ